MIIEALWYSLKSERVTPPALFFLLRIDLAVMGLLWLHINFRIICPRSVKSAMENLIRITLNPSIASCHVAILTILILPIQIFIPFCQNWYAKLINVHSSILFIPSVHLALTVSSLAAGLLWVHTVVSPSTPVPLCDTHPSASTWSAEGTTTAKGNRLSQGDPPPTGQPLASGGLLWAQGSSVPWPQLRTA